MERAPPSTAREIGGEPYRSRVVPGFQLPGCRVGALPEPVRRSLSGRSAAEMGALALLPLEEVRHGAVEFDVGTVHGLVELT